MILEDFIKFYRFGGEPITKEYVHIYLNYWNNCREKFYKII